MYTKKTMRTTLAWLVIFMLMAGKTSASPSTPKNYLIALKHSLWTDRSQLELVLITAMTAYAIYRLFIHTPPPPLPTTPLSSRYLALQEKHGAVLDYYETIMKAVFPLFQQANGSDKDAFKTDRDLYYKPKKKPELIKQVLEQITGIAIEENPSTIIPIKKG